MDFLEQHKVHLSHKNLDVDYDAPDSQSDSSDERLETWGRMSGHSFVLRMEIQRHGLNPLSLPGTIWSAMLALYLTDGCCRIMLPVAMQLAATICIQGYASYELALIMNEAIQSKDAPCIVQDYWLTRICSVVFIMLVFQELKETFDIGRWLSRFPTSRCWSTLKLQEFTSELEDDEAGRTIRVCALKPVSGITWHDRLMLSATVVLPKACLGFFILYYGAAYVMASADKESLLQNSVALVFILEIDNAVYQLLIPNHLKQAVSLLQEHPIALSSGEFSRDYERKYMLFGLVGLPIILVVALASLEWRWCDDGSDAIAERLPVVFSLVLAASVLMTTLSLQVFQCC